MGYVARVGDVVKSSSHTYTIKKEINKGGFADAYKAVNEDGDAVFLKQYKSPSKLVSWFKPYFSYEAELNRRLKNDPVLRNATVYAEDVFMAKVLKSDGYTPWTRNECLFQVFPFISGNTNLGDMIYDKAKLFSWEKRVYACAVFAFALRKLHDADVIHCDLKPENVQVKVDNTIAIKYRPLLVDMDWSILSDKKAPWHGKQGYVGTVGYNSPEHLSDKAPLEASDVFTAAIIMCEVLANKHPFESMLGKEDFAKYVLSGKNDFGDASKIPFIGEVTPKFRELVFNALSVDPKKRPTMEDIHLELMAMCKALGKPKVPGAVAAIKEAAREEKPASEPGAMPAKAVHKVYRDASMVDSGKGSALSTLIIKGNIGEFTTKTGFVLDQNMLKKVSSDAKYSDSVDQFSVHVEHGKWQIFANTDAANMTCLNGKELGSARVDITDNDIVELKGRSSGKTAMRLELHIR